MRDIEGKRYVLKVIEHHTLYYNDVQSQWSNECKLNTLLKWLRNLPVFLLWDGWKQDNS